MKNKGLIIGIICGVLVVGVVGFSTGCLIGYASGYSKGKKAELRRVDKDLAEEASKIGDPTTKRHSVTTTKNDIKNKMTKTYKFGEEGQSGAWNIKVLDSRETNTIDAGDGKSETTDQKFIVVHSQMTNKESAAIDYSEEEFTLFDSKTKTQYNISSKAMEGANEKEIIYNESSDFINAYDKVNPNIPKQTYFVFEVPNDFKISDGVLEHGNRDRDRDEDKEAIGYNIK